MAEGWGRNSSPMERVLSILLTYDSSKTTLSDESVENNYRPAPVSRVCCHLLSVGLAAPEILSRQSSTDIREHASDSRSRIMTKRENTL